MIDSDTDKPPSPAARGIASIDVIDSTRALPPEALEWLRSHTADTLVALGAAGEVRIRILADSEMAAAHFRYKGLPGPTDVLTFDLSGEFSSGPAGPAGELDVDILICRDEARRQAADRGHDPLRELLLYIIHGLLHCLGHDDHEPSAAAAMHAVEDRILEDLGVGATYARGPRDYHEPATPAGKERP